MARCSNSVQTLWFIISYSPDIYILFFIANISIRTHVEI